MAEAAIGAGGTIAGSLIGAFGAEAATKKGAKVQWKMFKKARKDARKDLAPWRGVGEAALGKLWRKIKKGPGEFVPEEQPGYKFGFEEFIEKPTLRKAGVKGRFFSPGTTKELTRYASDYASTKFDNFLSRYYSSLEPLQALSGTGQTTGAQLSRTGAYTGANIGQNYLSGGMDRTNALMAGISGLTNIGANYAQQYYNKKQPQNWLSGGVPIRR
jgi:hypothetical protein